MTGTSAAVQAACRRSAYRLCRTVGRKAEYSRFSVLPRPEIHRNLRIKDSVKIDLGGATGKKFKSSNKKVATVSSTGVVTIKKAGRVKITFKVGKKKRTVTLTVKDPTIPSYVTITAAGPLTGKKGDTVQLTAVLPEGTNSPIKWTSSNKKVATVSSTGLVTFKKAGSAKITATAKRGKKKAKVTVQGTK